MTWTICALTAVSTTNERRNSPTAPSSCATSAGGRRLCGRIELTSHYRTILCPTLPERECLSDRSPECRIRNGRHQRRGECFRRRHSRSGSSYRTASCFVGSGARVSTSLPSGSRRRTACCIVGWGALVSTTLPERECLAHELALASTGYDLASRASSGRLLAGWTAGRPFTRRACGRF